jgi:hypothetical protein
VGSRSSARKLAGSDPPAATERGARMYIGLGTLLIIIIIVVLLMRR